MTPTKEISCPFGCIFDGHKLMGDCRIPWAKDCALKVRRDLWREERSGNRLPAEVSDE